MATKITSLDEYKAQKESQLDSTAIEELVETVTDFIKLKVESEVRKFVEAGNPLNNGNISFSFRIVKKSSGEHPERPQIQTRLLLAKKTVYKGDELRWVGGKIYQGFISGEMWGVEVENPDTGRILLTRELIEEMFEVLEPYS